MRTIQVDLAVSFTYADRRYTPDLSWAEVSDAITKAALNALHHAGLSDHQTMEVSMHTEVMTQ